jgi:hypothetical protein
MVAHASGSANRDPQLLEKVWTKGPTDVRLADIEDKMVKVGMQEGA